MLNRRNFFGVSIAAGVLANFLELPSIADDHDSGVTIHTDTDLMLHSFDVCILTMPRTLTVKYFTRDGRTLHQNFESLTPEFEIVPYNEFRPFFSLHKNIGNLELKYTDNKRHLVTIPNFKLVSSRVLDKPEFPPRPMAESGSAMLIEAFKNYKG